jgi:GYF domain 2
MADKWYYWHDAEVLGPFSGRLLASLAAAGKLLPTDTVWKGEVEEGVLAAKVKHLFPQALTNSAPLTEAAVTVETQPTAGGVAVAAPDAVEAPPSWFSGRTAPLPQRGRAVAGKGAVLVGQDGTTVKFRKKCTTCGHEDSSWRSIPITKGTTRVTFYCPKCRRSCAVEVHGYLS